MVGGIEDCLEGLESPEQDEEDEKAVGHPGAQGCASSACAAGGNGEQRGEFSFGTPDARGKLPAPVPYPTGARGRQKRSSSKSAARAVSELTMSVSCGPTKFDMRNCHGGEYAADHGDCRPHF